MNSKFLPTLLLFFALTDLLPAQEEPPVLIYRDKVKIEEIRHRQFSDITHFPNEGNIIALNEDEGIVQLGSVLIGVVDFKTGKIKKRLDLYRVEALVSKSLTEAKGKEYCVSGREDFLHSQIRPEVFGMRFDKILKYSDASSYATLAHITVINQEDNYEMELFTGVLIFDEKLRPLNFLPLKGLENISTPPSIKFGGWFYDDFLFTKVPNVFNNLPYEFLKFTENEEGYFEFSDSLTYWPTIESEMGLASRFFGMYKRQNQYHISLGTQMVITESLSDSGKVIQAPIRDNQYLLSLEPLHYSSWILALVAEKIQSGRTLKANFSFINKDFSYLSPHIHYQISEVVPLSMTTFGQQIYLLMYERQKKYFYFDHLEYQPMEN